MIFSFDANSYINVISNSEQTIDDIICDQTLMIIRRTVGGY